MSEPKRALTMSFSGQRKPISKARPLRPAWKNELWAWAKREKVRVPEPRSATPVA